MGSSTVLLRWVLSLLLHTLARSGMVLLVAWHRPQEGVVKLNSDIIVYSTNVCVLRLLWGSFGSRYSITFDVLSQVVVGALCFSWTLYILGQRFFFFRSICFETRSFAVI